MSKPHEPGPRQAERAYLIHAGAMALAGAGALALTAVLAPVTLPHVTAVPPVAAALMGGMLFGGGYTGLKRLSLTQEARHYTRAVRRDLGAKAFFFIMSGILLFYPGYLIALGRHLSKKSA